MGGSIRRRGKSSWTVEVSAGFDPLTGKRRRVYRTVRGTKREAEREYARMVHELETGTDLSPTRTTCAEFFARWLEHARTRVRPKTWHGYAHFVRAYIVPRIGALPLTKVRPAHLQGILDAMGKSPSTIRQCYVVLSSAFKQARLWQMIATNPAEAVRPPRVERAKLSTPDAWKMKTLLKVSEGSFHHGPLVVAVATGMRRGEVLGLRWPDLDLEDAKIHVTAALQRLPKNEAAPSWSSFNRRQTVPGARSPSPHSQWRSCAASGRNKRSGGCFWERPGTTATSCSTTETDDPGTRTPSEPASGGSPAPPDSAARGFTTLGTDTPRS